MTDLEAQVSAFVADKYVRSSYQLVDVILALAAEIAVEGVRHHSYSVITGRAPWVGRNDVLTLDQLTACRCQLVDVDVCLMLLVT